jgi:ubiquitin-protein ligase
MYNSPIIYTKIIPNYSDDFKTNSDSCTSSSHNLEETLNKTESDISPLKIEPLFQRRVYKELKTFYCETFLQDLKDNVSFVFDSNESKLYIEFIGYKDTDYENGQYFLVLDIPKEYPMKRPIFQVLTESGRFKINTPVAYMVGGSVFDDVPYDNNDWSPTLTFTSFVLMIISSFTDDSIYGIGYLKNDSKTKKHFAVESHEYNKKHNQKLLKMFEEVHILKEKKDTSLIIAFINEKLKEVKKRMVQ